MSRFFSIEMLPSVHVLKFTHENISGEHILVTWVKFFPCKLLNVPEFVVVLTGFLEHARRDTFEFEFFQAVTCTLILHVVPQL